MKDVRGKINIIKQRHVLKGKRRAKSKIKNFDEMTADLKAKGIDVNEESLSTRISKGRKSIGQIESQFDSRAKSQLQGLDDSSDDSDVESDEELRQDEGERRGRKRTRDGDVDMSAPKVKLGKRRRSHDADIDMDESSDNGQGMSKGVRGSRSARNARMTPEQRKVSVQKL